MTRRFTGRTLVLASHNPGKAAELRDLLGGLVQEIPGAADLDIPEPEETGEDFRANAELKARFVAGRAGLPALADDSGLAVAALGGDPGVRSARWALQPDGRRDFGRAMGRVEDALARLGPAVDRTAEFVCALTIAWPDGHAETVEGRVRGELVWPPRGRLGFGYDPVFRPEGHDRTFGEMPAAEKHAISHRADAFRQILDRCFTP